MLFPKNRFILRKDMEVIIVIPSFIKIMFNVKVSDDAGYIAKTNK